MEPLSREAFRDALRKGLGRAIRHVEHYGAGGLIEDILFAATHSLVHDRGFEGNRYDWVLRLIELTGIKGYFRDHILPALSKAREKDDLSLLYALACDFAEDGDAEARDLIYEKFDRQEMSEPWLGGTSLVSLDGMKGFLHIAEVIGSRIQRDPVYRARLEKSGENDYMLSIASDHLEKHDMLEALEARTRENEAIRLYLEISRKYLEKNKADDVSRPDESITLTADEIIEAIEQLQWNEHYEYMRIGWRLSSESVNQIFEALLKETRNEQIIRYLWLFPYKRTFPRFDGKLLELATSEDPRISKETLEVLARLNDPRIRDFAIEYLGRPGTKAIPRLIRLFQDPYQSGDAEIILKSLKIPDDPDIAHFLAQDIWDLDPGSHASEIRELWLWAYEHSPCSFCRQGIVRRLIEAKMAPREILWECLEDCDSDTRQLARDALDNHGLSWT